MRNSGAAGLGYVNVIICRWQRLVSDRACTQSSKANQDMRMEGQGSTESHLGRSSGLILVEKLQTVGRLKTNLQRNTKIVFG